MINDQQIYEFIAKTSKARAVQIADAYDAELVDVSNALRSLVEVGDVVQSKGFSPNGTSAQCYDLSAEFMASKEYRALLALMEVAPIAPVVSAPAAPAPPVAVPQFLAKRTPPPARKPAGKAKQVDLGAQAFEAAADCVLADAAPTAPSFRCGLWSDGTLEMQRNGVTVAAVSRGEAEALMAFLGSVAAAKVAA